MISIKLEYSQLIDAILQLSESEKKKLVSFLENRDVLKENRQMVHQASEKTLAKEWLNETEEKAWENL
jgi:ADP-dependent phosphofructokinase/glucokinase